MLQAGLVCVHTQCTPVIHTREDVSQCVAVCCSVLQGVAVCCSVLYCVAAYCRVLPCVAVCCSVLLCVALCFLLALLDTFRLLSRMFHPPPLHLLSRVPNPFHTSLSPPLRRHPFSSNFSCHPPCSCVSCESPPTILSLE